MEGDAEPVKECIGRKADDDRSMTAAYVSTFGVHWLR